MKKLLLTGVIAFFYLVGAGSVLGQNTLVATSGTATLDGVISPNEYTSTPLVTKNNVTLYAMADKTHLYMAARWQDATKTVNKHEWTFDGTNWTVTGGDEDRIAFVWDMGKNGVDGANCTTMCHLAENKMHTTVGPVDVWHWKAARGGVIGYLDDKWWDTVDRQSDSGTSAYQDNVNTTTNLPLYMAAGGPGVAADFLGTSEVLGLLLPSETNTIKEAVPFNPAGFAAGAKIPGYRIRKPAGDRASVETRSLWNNGVWTVEFKKPRAGTNADFAVTAGASVKFTHEIFDNVGEDHSLNGYDPTIYTLSLANIVAVESTGGEVPETFALEQNYPNPFNPETTISFAVKAQAPVTLRVFDALGRVVDTLVDEEMAPGNYQVSFSGAGLASGVYYYILQAQNYSQSRLMVLLK